MLTKPAKWNIISLGSLFSIWAKKCFELWLKNMCTSRICSNELCIILQMKQFWLLLGQIEKIGLLLFRHLVPLPIYRPIFVHVYSVLSLSFSLNLSVNVISPSLSLSTILYSIRLSHFQFDRNFLSLSFVPPSHDTTFTTKALGSKWAPLSIQISFRKSSRGASPESTPPQGNIIFARKINEKGSSSSSSTTTI